MESKDTQKMYLITGFIVFAIIVGIDGRNRSLQKQSTQVEVPENNIEIVEEQDIQQEKTPLMVVSVEAPEEVPEFEQEAKVSEEKVSDAAMASFADIKDDIAKITRELKHEGGVKEAEVEQELAKNSVEYLEDVKPVPPKDESPGLFKVQKGFTLPKPASFSNETEDIELSFRQKLEAEETEEPEAEPLAQNLIEMEMNQLRDKKLIVVPRGQFEIHDPNLNVLIDYEQYGEFKDLDTANYRFVVTKRREFREDIGSGIYPSHLQVKKEPAYQDYLEDGKLNIHHWTVLNSDDHLRAFYVWATANEDPGVRTYFTGQILENAGHLLPALKAYYAALVHFPRSVAWSADGNFVWYIGPAAIESINRICANHPELNVELKGAIMDVENGSDTDLSNDVIRINPGKLVRLE